MVSLPHYAIARDGMMRHGLAATHTLELADTYWIADIDANLHWLPIGCERNGLVIVPDVRCFPIVPENFLAENLVETDRSFQVEKFYSLIGYRGEILFRANILR